MRTRLSYYDEFDHNSNDAAIKFAINALLDYDPQRLREFMEPDAPYGSYGGDGGWRLEKRYRPPKAPMAYDDWPDWADYRAYVDPDEYYLLYPEGFYDEATFKQYLREGLREYLKKWPDKRKEIDQLVRDLDIGTLEEG